MWSWSPRECRQQPTVNKTGGTRSLLPLFGTVATETAAASVTVLKVFDAFHDAACRYERQLANLP